MLASNFVVEPLNVMLEAPLNSSFKLSVFKSNLISEAPLALTSNTFVLIGELADTAEAPLA